MGEREGREGGGKERGGIAATMHLEWKCGGGREGVWEEVWDGQWGGGGGGGRGGGDRAPGVKACVGGRAESEGKAGGHKTLNACLAGKRTVHQHVALVDASFARTRLENGCIVSAYAS